VCVCVYVCVCGNERVSLSISLSLTRSLSLCLFLHQSLLHLITRSLSLSLSAVDILYDWEQRIKVCDFGLAEFEAQDSKTTGLRGSPFKMAPELFKADTTPSAKNDVWSFAVTLWEMLMSERVGVCMCYTHGGGGLGCVHVCVCVYV
jgi:serine/threonine-protein kinase ULK4